MSLLHLKTFFSLAPKVTLFQVKNAHKNCLRPACMLVFLPTSIHISPLTPCLLLQNRVSVQRPKTSWQKAVDWIKRSLGAAFPGLWYVCVCVLSGVCTALKNDTTCCNPNAAAAIVASLVTAQAHSKRKIKPWHSTFLIFDSFTYSLNSNLLELSHVLTCRYIFNWSCDSGRSWSLVFTPVHGTTTACSNKAMLTGKDGFSYGTWQAFCLFVFYLTVIS